MESLKPSSKGPATAWNEGSALGILADVLWHCPQFWINLQSRYDLRCVQIKRAKSILARVQPLLAETGEGRD
jgi:plasmid maintenance system antidote protein VapI